MAPQPFSAWALGTLHVSAVQAYRAAGSIWRHSLSVSVPLGTLHVSAVQRITRQVVYGAAAFQCLRLWYPARVRCAGTSRGRWYMAPHPFSVSALGILHVSAVQAYHAAGSIC